MRHITVGQQVSQYKWQLGAIAVGIGLMGVGIILAQRQTKGNELTIVSPSPGASGSVSGTLGVKEVVIDIEGAVEKPGVHRLTNGARIAEALIAAGGLAAEADRSFVARFINQAEVVKDGAKVYIPQVGEKTEQLTATTSQAGSGTVPQLPGVISINTASEQELDSLWGVGAARAKAIIDNRPYTTIDELVTKAKIPQDVVDKNNDKWGL